MTQTEDEMHRVALMALTPNERRDLEGVTPRQWYAGLAMIALLFDSRLKDQDNEAIAEQAFFQADAMLAHEAREAAA
jgi:hypothetical protein